jgi:hypothetical protein
MSDGLKSTLDIAMERMKNMLGEEAVKLTDDQKKRIAEVKTEHEAKIAENKILLAGSEELAGELQKLKEAQAARIEAIYQESNDKK